MRLPVFEEFLMQREYAAVRSFIVQCKMRSFKSVDFPAS
jgi:hypothetical protein